MDRPEVSPDELIREGTAPPSLDGNGAQVRAFDFLPAPDEPIPLFPPLEIGPIDDDAPLVERLDRLWSAAPDGETSSEKPALDLSAFDLSESDLPAGVNLTSGGEKEVRPTRRGRAPQRGKRTSEERALFLRGGLSRSFRRLPWYAVFPALLLSRRGLGVMVSVIFHLLILIVLAALVIRIQSGSRGEPLETGFSDSEEVSLTDDAGETLQESDLTNLFGPVTPNQTMAAAAENSTENDFAALLTDVDDSALSVRNLSSADALDGSGLAAGFVIGGKATSGRNAETRKKGLPGREGDSTDASERAVEAGLAWLAAHQLPDGGWSFDLAARDDNGRPGECQGRCSNSVSTSGAVGYRMNLYPSRSAATGIALLAFLGAGYDHQKPGLYQKTVAAGLNYLKYRAAVTPHGVDFREDGERYGMYTQSIVVVTICEAFELTGDPELKTLAGDGAKFIAESQRDDGGWRYEAVGDPNFYPHVPGDTSVSGWQLLAVKSAMSAGFEFSPELFYKVGYFLDGVQADDNALYRYQTRTNEAESEIWGTTAVGLLMREYLGWGPDRKEMKRGIKKVIGWFDRTYDNWRLAKRGKREKKEGRPILSGDGRFYYNLYFAYYAALALHHFGGKSWHRTFAATRDFLIESQSDGSANPHEAGSWLFYDRYLNDGGRLLNTAISVLILETPYRYLPMYQ